MRIWKTKRPPFLKSSQRRLAVSSLAILSDFFFRHTFLLFFAFTGHGSTNSVSIRIYSIPPGSPFHFVPWRNSPINTYSHHACENSLFVFLFFFCQIALNICSERSRKEMGRLGLVLSRRSRPIQPLRKISVREVTAYYCIICTFISVLTILRKCHE